MFDCQRARDYLTSTLLDFWGAKKTHVLGEVALGHPNKYETSTM